MPTRLGPLLTAEFGLKRLGLQALRLQPAHHDRHLTMRDHHPLRATRSDRLLQPRPVGMVRKHEATVDAAASACAAQGHPA